MTEIERKALALVNEVSDGFHDVASIYDIHTAKALRSALCRAIEQHDAFRQEVSDAVVQLLEWPSIRAQGILTSTLCRFIIAKPVDPLVEALKAIGASWPEAIDRFRAALAARGLKIVEDK